IGRQHKACAHENGARNYHRPRTDPVGDMTRGSTQDEVDESREREDGRDCRAPAVELGTDWFYESAEAVNDAEGGEHRNKGGEGDDPGARRIGFSRQNALERRQPIKGGGSRKRWVGLGRSHWMNSQTYNPAAVTRVRNGRGGLAVWPSHIGMR